MAMTRKNYEAVAQVLRQVRQDWKGEGDVQVALSYVASGLAGVFAADNQRFDRTKFIQAAGGGL